MYDNWKENPEFKKRNPTPIIPDKEYISGCPEYTKDMEINKQSLKNKVYLNPLTTKQIDSVIKSIIIIYKLNNSDLSKKQQNTSTANINKG